LGPTSERDWSGSPHTIACSADRAGNRSGVGEAGSAPLRARFPARPVATAWPQTRLSRQSVVQRLASRPFVMDTPAGEENRRRGVRIVLDWLETQPGDSWQQRWLASGAEDDGRPDWRGFPIRWRKATTSFDCRFDAAVLGSGLLSLICADVIRPRLAWLLTTATPKRLAAEMARTRDPVGFAELTARCQASPVGESTTRVALHRIAIIMAAKGGAVADITVGDCLELLEVAAKVCTISNHKAPTSTSCCTRLACLVVLPRRPCGRCRTSGSSVWSSWSIAAASSAGRCVSCWSTICGNARSASTTSR
jgi:hypothetical protein